MNPIRVLLADDHTLVRAGVKALLVRIPGVEVVGEAANGREALRLMKGLAPDVALMDIAMPELNGLDATAHAARDHPGVRVIIVSMHASEPYVQEALAAGAAGYLLKDADLDELERAIRSVMRGGRYLTPAVSRHLIGGSRGGASAEAPRGGALSARQREVLQLVAEGRSTREIAERLHLSVKTVESHRAQLMEKLQIFEVAGLTRYAIRTGLIQPDR
jgi:DNA-binding NarL/FixJ family response regulator